MLALFAGPYLYFHHARRLTDKDTIVLADFVNKTGDSIFDGTLRQGLAIQLEQSPFLNLLSDIRIKQTLALMVQPEDARVTPDLARQVCQRTGSAATIEGSIASLGRQYVVGLKAVNCRSGDTLGEEQMTAYGKEQVLKVLGDVSTKLRAKLGESLVSVEKNDAPLENVTTPSLEALQAYTLGYQAQVIKDDWSSAIPFFQRATRLDPNFAMAWARLGTIFGNLGETASAAESMRKAYQLGGRVSERERFYIGSHYELDVTGDLEAARRIYEMWAQTYKRDFTPLDNLCRIYSIFGEYNKALAAAQEAFKLNPGSANGYTNLIGSYMHLNRLDDARAAAQDARAHNAVSPLCQLILYMVDFLRHDFAGMEHDVSELISKPTFEDQMLYLESETATYVGQFVKARVLTRRATDLAKRASETEQAAGYEAEAGLREVLVGNTIQARRYVQAALAFSNG
jgi:tetratricopeptide (TPR) repeat protein